MAAAKRSTRRRLQAQLVPFQLIGPNMKDNPTNASSLNSSACTGSISPHDFGGGRTITKCASFWRVPWIPPAARSLSTPPGAMAVGDKSFAWAGCRPPWGVGFQVPPRRGGVGLHCHRGQNRTGIMVAIYRIVHDGWSSRQAYEEARQFGMSRWNVLGRHLILDEAAQEFVPATARR